MSCLPDLIRTSAEQIADRAVQRVRRRYTQDQFVVEGSHPHFGRWLQVDLVEFLKTNEAFVDLTASLSTLPEVQSIALLYVSEATDSGVRSWVAQHLTSPWVTRFIGSIDPWSDDNTQQMSDLWVEFEDFICAKSIRYQRVACLPTVRLEVDRMCLDEDLEVAKCPPELLADLRRYDRRPERWPEGNVDHVVCIQTFEGDKGPGTHRPLDDKVADVVRCLAVFKDGFAPFDAQCLFRDCWWDRHVRSEHLWQISSPFGLDTYELTEADATALPAFWANARSRVRDLPKVPLERYMEAARRESTVDQVVDLVIALEGLLSGGPGPAGFAIPVRAAHVVSDTRIERIETFALIGDAIDLRNSLLHGGTSGLKRSTRWSSSSRQRLVVESVAAVVRQVLAELAQLTQQEAGEPRKIMRQRVDSCIALGLAPTPCARAIRTGRIRVGSVADELGSFWRLYFRSKRKVAEYTTRRERV